MAFKKKKKDDWDGLPVKETNRIFYKKEELDEFQSQLKKGGYLTGESQILTLEKQFDWLAKKEIIKLKKKHPQGMNKTMCDFEISVRPGMSVMFDEEINKIDQLINRKGFISDIKNQSLLYPVSLVKKYAPNSYTEKRAEQKKLELKLPPKPPAAPKKPLVPIEPTKIDPNDIKL